MDTVDYKNITTLHAVDNLGEDVCEKKLLVNEDNANRLNDKIKLGKVISLLSQSTQIYLKCLMGENNSDAAKLYRENISKLLAEKNNLTRKLL